MKDCSSDVTIHDEGAGRKVWHRSIKTKTQFEESKLGSMLNLYCVS
jgi:hypothetical protein